MGMTEHYSHCVCTFLFGFWLQKKKEPLTFFTRENASIYWSLENKLLNQSLSQHHMWKESYWPWAARRMRNKQCGQVDKKATAHVKPEVWLVAAKQACGVCDVCRL